VIRHVADVLLDVLLTQAAQETAAAGKADAAWQGPPDTANSCDSSSGTAQQQEAA